MTIEVLENGAERFTTAGGVTITRERHNTPYAGAIEAYVDGLNSRRGAVFSSNYEYPGRYTRWDTAIIDPPVVISARGGCSARRRRLRWRRHRACRVARG